MKSKPKYALLKNWPMVIYQRKKETAVAWFWDEFKAEKYLKWLNKGKGH